MSWPLQQESRLMVLGGLIVLLLGAACARPGRPASLTIAAAADLNFAMEEIAHDFGKAHPGIDLHMVYGSSGNFYAQIRNRAPFDMFLSADVEYPRKLAQEGLAPADSLFVYAVGRIVVWVPEQSSLDPATALTAGSVRHVAIANPQHAPYGRAAVAAMRQMGVYDRVEEKLVLGENVSQTLQFIQSGAAETGIVALSLAIAPPVRSLGRYWQVPLEAYPKMEQGGIILKEWAAAREFRSYLLAPDGRATLERYGFYPPGK